MSAAPVVSDATFDSEVLKSKEPVLVDFFAEWCGPCKALAPSINQVAGELAGKLKVVKVDVDASPGITTKYKIQAMPTLILFADGKEVNRRQGLMSKTVLDGWVKSSVKV